MPEMEGSWKYILARNSRSKSGEHWQMRKMGVVLTIWIANAMAIVAKNENSRRGVLKMARLAIMTAIGTDDNLINFEDHESKYTFVQGEGGQTRLWTKLRICRTPDITTHLLGLRDEGRGFGTGCASGKQRLGSEAADTRNVDDDLENHEETRPFQDSPEHRWLLTSAREATRHDSAGKG